MVFVGIMATSYQFIVNPKSGSSAHVRSVRALCDVLRRRHCRVHIELTQSLGHAAELAGRARATNAAAVIVAGGDGTVRAVAAGMAGSQMPMLIVPTGTENLFACQLGLDGSEELTLRTLDHGQARGLDLGLANQRYFIAIAGVGFDAEVVQRINRFRSGHITHTDYVWPICRTFWEHCFPHLNVVADGELICDEPALLFVSNISRYAVGLKVSPEADFSNGYLDVTVYKCRRRRRLLLHSGLTILGQSHHSSLVVRRRCRQLHVEAAEPAVPVQLDGDPGPALPLDVRVVPAAARVLAPPPKGDPGYLRPARFYHLRAWLFR